MKALGSAVLLSVAMTQPLASSVLSAKGLPAESRSSTDEVARLLDHFVNTLRSAARRVAELDEMENHMKQILWHRSQMAEWAHIKWVMYAQFCCMLMRFKFHLPAACASQGALAGLMCCLVALLSIVLQCQESFNLLELHWIWQIARVCAFCY